MKRINPLIIMMVLTAIMISVSAICFHQPFIRILPLYISLVVSFLQSRVNRFAPLLGGLNCILYAGVYVFYKLYGMAAYSFFVSFPLQIITFIRWNRRPYGESTVLKRMNKRAVIITAGCFALAWLGVSFLLSLTDSTQSLLDSTVSLTGVLENTLLMLSFSEYTYITVSTAFFNTALHISMIIEGNMEQVAFFVYDIYRVTCSSIAVKRAKKILSELSALKQSEGAE